MTTADESKASFEAVSSTFGLPEGVLDTVSGVVLCESHRNTPSLDENVPVGVGTPEEREEGDRGLYRLGFIILLLILGILTDSRRLVDAASLMLP